jgi:hypothetical protein
MGEISNTLPAPDAQPEEKKPLKAVSGMAHLSLDAEPKGRFVWGGNHPDVPKMNEALFDGYAKQDQPDKDDVEIKE